MKASFVHAIWSQMVLACLVASASAADPQTATFKTKGGTDMQYITQGDTGSWVVLIPGLSDNPQRMYVDSGMMAALAKNHRVVATPQPGAVKGPGDVAELMDHLKIDKAHIYGYSMGGGFTGTLLAWYPERFITAAFGGSGIWEYEQEQHDRANALDQALLAAAGRAGRGARGAGGRSARGGGGGDAAQRGAGGRGASDRGGRAGGAARGGGMDTSNDPRGKAAEGLPVPVAAARPHSKTPIDLAKVNIPVLAINGSFDQPFVKSQRMFRELRDFQNVILPGHDHMSAIGVNATFPPEHVAALVRFINANDPKP